MAGFSVLPTHIVRDGSIELAAKALLLVLSSYTDEDGECWPSVSLLASNVGLSKRQAQRLLKRLEQSEHVVVMRRFNKNNPKIPTSNTYRLNFNKWGSARNQKEMTDVSGGSRQICQGGGDTDDTRVVTPVSPEQEHLTKPPKKKDRSVAQAPPSPDEVKEYFSSIGGDDRSARDFHDYWDDMGWRRKTGPMKSWKGSARTWQRRNDDRGSAKKSGSVPDKSRSTNYNQHPRWEEDW